MSELSEADRFAMVMARLSLERRPAKSLFLALVPRRKFPPPDLLSLPSLVLVRIATDIAFRAIFPFLFDRANAGIASEAAFHDIIDGMAADKTDVIKCPITIALEDGIDTTLKLEFCFASRLLSRIRTLGEAGLSGRPYFYHFLVDLLCQANKHADALVLTTDDDGNFWLRLRAVTGYRPDAFFSDVTILIHNIRSLVRVVFAEGDGDIDEWYRYEWMSPIVKEALFQQGLPAPVGGNKQAIVLGGFLEKLAKLLAEKPR